MKIKEFILVPKKSQDTTSCGTTYSGQKAGSTQDIVSQDLVPETIDGHIVEQPDHSAITEGVSQILRRRAGKGLSKGFRCTTGPRKGRIVAKASTCFAKRDPVKGLTKGFRCTSGPRKGRIVAKPSTCFAKRDPVKGAKIKKKRQAKAKIAGKKLAITKRSRPVSRRLKNVQLKQKSSGRKGGGTRKLQKSGGGFLKSKSR